MDYRILGPLEVRAGGRHVPLRGARQRELLAVLLLHANEIVSSDRLIDELWQGDPPPTAAKIVQNSVSQLRKLLEPGLLVTRSPGYLLRVEGEELDSERFERMVEEARADLAGGTASEAAEQLRDAAELWRGPALSDFSDAPFARAESARLEELRSAATEDRIEAELALGRHAQLVPELEALVAQYPLRERLRAQLMVALYRSGRQAEALRVYHETREVLVEELGLEPGRALQRLERAVLLQDPALELGPEEEAVGPPRPAEIARPEVRKTVSVVAADVLALGGPHDPETLRPPMTRAVETVTDVLQQHGASTEGSTTGGVIGIFGVPEVHEDDALRAVRAASEARDALRDLSPELERDWNVAVALRAGVNTGEVVAGNTSAHTLVAGDAVTVAARLQQAADPGEILLDAQTEELVHDALRAEPVDPAALKATGHGTAWRLLELEAEAPGYARRLETPLIGRVVELAQLRQAYERTAEDRAAHLFTVLGAAGIGKSRLARELVLSTGDESTVLQGHCPSYGEGVTFWPLRGIVQDVGDLREALAGEDEAGAIAERVLGAVGLEGKASTNEETFWATRKLFEALARTPARRGHRGRALGRAHIPRPRRAHRGVVDQLSDPAPLSRPTGAGG
jgi:DNA-binding SARP family transcriptional activator